MKESILDINKFIEEEARKYASVAHEITDVEKLRDFPGAKNVYNKYKAFEAGANFVLSKRQEANRWRKVEEELPEADSYFLIRNPNSSSVYVARYYPAQKRFVDTRGHSIYYSNNIEWKRIEE